MTPKETLVTYVYRKLGKPKRLALPTALKAAEIAADRLLSTKSAYDEENNLYTVKHLANIFDWAVEHKYWHFVNDVPSLSKALLEGPETNGLEAQYDDSMRVCEDGWQWQDTPVPDKNCTICKGTGQNPLRINVAKLKDDAPYADLVAKANAKQKEKLEYYRQLAIHGVGLHTEGRDCKCVKYVQKKVFTGTIE
jgi:hypothetical protein